MDVVERLTLLGFSPHEARLYVALLRHPSATGYELAKAAGLPRANVYQVLTSLLAKSAIQLVSDDPARYVAHAPADVIGRIKRATTANCLAVIDDLASLTPAEDSNAFWTLRGRNAVVDRIIALISESRSRIAISLWADDLSWLRTPMRDAWRRGCQVVINVFGEADLEFGDIYRHEDPSKLVSGHLLTLACDTRAALVAAFDEPIGAVYTQHGALVQLVEKIIRDEAYLAAIYERLRPEVEHAFGPHLVDLRRRLLPTDQADHLLSIVGFGATTSGSAAELFLDDA